MPHCAADRLRGHFGKPFFFGDFVGNIPVRNHLSVRNFPQDFPYGLPERAACGRKRKLRNIRPRTLKIAVQPGFGLAENIQIFFLVHAAVKGAFKILLAVNPQPGEVFAVADERHVTQRRFVKGFIVHIISLCWRERSLSFRSPRHPPPPKNRGLLLNNTG